MALKLLVARIVLVPPVRAEAGIGASGAVGIIAAAPPRRPDTMFDHLYADLPQVYTAQRRELAGEHDD